MSEMAWVTMRMAEKEERRRRGGGGGAGEPQKVRTPHKDVGKNDNHSENSEFFSIYRSLHQQGSQGSREEGGHGCLVQSGCLEPQRPESERLVLRRLKA